MTPVDLLVVYQRKVLRSIANLVQAAETEAHAHPDGSEEFKTGHIISNTLVALGQQLGYEYEMTKKLQGEFAKDPKGTEAQLQAMLQRHAAAEHGIKDAPEDPHGQ